MLFEGFGAWPASHGRSECCEGARGDGSSTQITQERVLNLKRTRTKTTKGPNSETDYSVRRIPGVVQSSLGQCPVHNTATRPPSAAS